MIRLCSETFLDLFIYGLQFTHDQFQLRSRASHNRHCQLVHDDQTLASTYGVKRSSILNQSRYFHVVDGLDLDVMHDQLEGVLPLEIKLLLQKYITVDKYLTLDVLNERIAGFSYPLVDASNKPSLIKQQAFCSDSASLSQSGEGIMHTSVLDCLLVVDVVFDFTCIRFLLVSLVAGKNKQ